MSKDRFTACLIDGCMRNSAGRFFCVHHAKMIPYPIHDTIRLLHNHGQPRGGFDEALANAKLQIMERVRGEPNPFAGDAKDERRPYSERKPRPY